MKGNPDSCLQLHTMRKIILFAFSGILFLFVAYAFLNDYQRNGDTLFYNGDILTMMDSSAYVEALYVQNGRIRATGSKDSLFSLRTQRTQLVDLKGKTLMPGFIDAHGHLDVATIYTDMLDVSGFHYKTQAAVWAAISEKVRQTEPGQWIICHGLDPILTKDLRSPTRSFLDSIAPQHPLVIITQALHTFYANSRAFEKAGIDNQTLNPSKSSYYARDAAGNLNGQIIEQAAFEPFRLIIKDISKKTFLQNTQKQLHKSARHGITTTVTMGVLAAQKPLFLLYEHLSGAQATFLGNVFQMLGIFPKRGPNPRHFIYLRREDSRFLPVQTHRQSNDFFSIIGVKFWYDGSPYSASMYLEEPYAHSDFITKELGLDSLHQGSGLFTPPDFEAAIRAPLRDGWKIAIHTQGDQALKEIIPVLEKMHQQYGISGRVRLEHCMFFPEEEMKRAAAMGVSASFHVNHLLYYGDFLSTEVIGHTRAQQIFPVHSFQQTGLPFSLHADQPMFEADPLSLARTAVLRRSESGLVLNPAESISVWEALKSITVYAAAQLDMLPQLGTLEAGKYADMVELDQNPLRVPSSQLADIKVRRAWVAGNPLW